MMNHSDLPCYEVIALKYATREGRRPDHFVGGDPHDVPMPMDYYLWVIRDGQRLVLVDTGFNQDMADKRHRTLLRRPADALKLLGIGTVDDLSLEVSGASDAKLYGLVSKGAVVHASGASHAQLNVTEMLKAQSNGASNIDYKGNPNVKETTSGASSIKHRN